MERLYCRNKTFPVFLSIKFLLGDSSFIVLDNCFNLTVICARKNNCLSSFSDKYLNLDEKSFSKKTESSFIISSNLVLSSLFVIAKIGFYLPPSSLRRSGSGFAQYLWLPCITSTDFTEFFI